MHTFKVGDEVLLKGFGTYMKVVGVAGLQCACRYVDKAGIIHKDDFHSEELELIEENSPSEPPTRDREYDPKSVSWV